MFALSFSSLNSVSFSSLTRSRCLSSFKFVIRMAKTADEVQEVFVPRLIQQGWKAGALDHAISFQVDKTGFFVGELNGKVMSCMSAFKYSREYAFIGNLIIDEPYQNLGYGSFLFRTVTSALPKGCNYAADTFEEQVPRYLKYGYKRAWNNKRYIFNTTQALAKLWRPQYQPGVRIEKALDVPFPKLLEYDISVHIYERALFLKKWISASNCYSYAAINNSDRSVVGYAVVRSALGKENGWKIGPLYADNSTIARYLYGAIFDKLSDIDPAGAVTIDTPCSKQCDPESVRIISELGAATDEVSVRMFSKYVPNNWPLNKVYGITSQQLG